MSEATMTEQVVKEAEDWLRAYGRMVDNCGGPDPHEFPRDIIRGLLNALKFSQQLEVEIAEQVEGLQLIADLVGGAGGLLDAAFLAGMVQAELERAARENATLRERERKAEELLKDLRTFIEYARFELEPKLESGAQFPSQECADERLAAIDAYQRQQQETP